MDILRMNVWGSNMDIFSILLLVLIGIWFCLAIRSIFRNSKNGGCMGCGGIHHGKGSSKSVCKGKGDSCSDCNMCQKRK